MTEPLHKRIRTDDGANLCGALCDGLQLVHPPDLGTVTPSTASEMGDSAHEEEVDEDVDEHDLFGSDRSDSGSEVSEVAPTASLVVRSPDGSNQEPEAAYRSVVRTVEDADAFADWLDDYEHGLVHLDGRPPEQAARMRADATIAQLRWAGPRNNVQLLRSLPGFTTFEESRAAAPQSDVGHGRCAGEPGGEPQLLPSAVELVAREERRVVGELNAQAPPLFRSGPERSDGALSEAGMVAMLAQRVDETLWQRPKGFTLPEWWREVKAVLTAWKSFDESARATYYARLISRLMHQPHDCFDKMQCQGEPRETIAEILGVARDDGSGELDESKHTPMVKGPLRFVLPTDAAEEACERYGPLPDGSRLRVQVECSTPGVMQVEGPLLEFVLPTDAAAALQRYGRCPRPLRVLVEFAPPEPPAEATVLLIHPITGMRIQYDDGTLSWLHNADDWKWA